MSEGDGSEREDINGDKEQLLQELLISALREGDHDHMLELAQGLLEKWPRQRIRDSNEWRILAALSQVGADDRRLGIAATMISRKVALTARLSYYKTRNSYDIICRTVALSAYEELTLEQAVRCLRVEGHAGHYAASRLGIASYRQKNVEILELCIKRAKQNLGSITDLADPELELETLRCCHNILLGRDPELHRLISLYRATDEKFKERYFHSLSILIDPEDLEYGD